MSSSFGRLALGTVGAIIGAPLLLSGVGFSIGSALGGFIFAPEVDGPNVEGPRVGDTDVATSTLGKTLPEHYGVTRSAGNIIWSAGLKEVKTTEEIEGGGKGGGSAGTSSTYSYFANFASAFGRGRAADILRLWADGKLIYDVSGTDAIQNDKYKFRFYEGTSDQAVDPLIQESVNRRLQGLPDVNEGSGQQASFRTIFDLVNDAQIAAAAGDPRASLYATYLEELEANAPQGIPNDYGFTPAYRDTCMIVFENMPLEDFGNRIPNITAEIAWGDIPQSIADSDGGPRQVTVLENSSNTAVPLNGVGVDSGRGIIIVRSEDRLRKFSSIAGSETLNRPATQSVGEVGSVAVSQIIGETDTGDMVTKLTTDTGTTILGKISSTSLLITGAVSDDGQLHTLDNRVSEITFGASLGTRTDTELFAGISPSGYFYALRTDTPNLQRVYGGPESEARNVLDFLRGNVRFIGDGPMCSAGLGTVYALAHDDTRWQLVRAEVEWGGEVSFATLLGRNSSGVAVDGDTVTDRFSLDGRTVSSVVYDSSENRIYTLFRVGTTAGQVRKYTPNGSLVYAKSLTLPPPMPESGIQRSSITNGKIVYAHEASVAEIDLITGDETVYAGVLTGNATADVQIYESARDTLYTWVDGSPYKIELGKNSSVSTYQTNNTLQRVVSSICTRTGMRADEYDVSGIAPEHFVRGYTVGRPSTGRAALEKLLLAYFVDGIESDYTVKFSDRTVTPVRTIFEDDLGTLNGPTGAINFLESRAPDYGLPVEVNVVYNDQDRDYQQGTAQFRRVSQPVQVMHSNKTDNVEIPIVFTEPEAADIAQRILFMAWQSRDSGKTQTHWSHLDLDPGDVVNIAFNDGRTITDRIGKSTVGANFEIEMETSRSGDPVYTASTLSPLLTGSVPSNGILTPVHTELFVLDTPLLEDYHDLGRSAFRYYTAVGSETTQWLSATLYASFNSTQYQSFDSSNVDITWGQCQNVLKAPRALWCTDTENTLTILLSVDNEDVASVTRDEIINNKANRAFVWNPHTGEGELIQFQDVVINSDNSITISNISRGLRGTDYAAYTHVPGEYFLFVNESAYLSQTNPLEVLGSTEYFRAVSIGGLLASTPTVTTTWQGRDLRPYAPSRIRRATSGETLTVSWERRTRIGGEWNMFVSDVEIVPLNEDSESYEFYLLLQGTAALDAFDPDDASTYSLKRVVSSPNYTVTAEELIAAGLTTGDPINIAVAQVSAQVGRGFVASGELAP